MAGQTIWTEGDRPRPVNRAHPLRGIEEIVLGVWLENSPVLRKAHRSQPSNRRRVESAVRQRVFDARVLELRLRARGLSQPEAMSQARQDLWTPPAWPTQRRKRRPTPAASRPATTRSPSLRT